MDIPKHIGIIMDGNRRWAKAHALPSVEGYRLGVENVRASVKWCVKQGVKVLTLFAFSSENWDRPAKEVKYLLGLFMSALKEEIDQLATQGVRFHVIGRLADLSATAKREIEIALDKTKRNSRLVFNFAFNYGGRAEIVDAIKSIVGKKTVPGQINEALVSQHMYAPGLPDPDLIIRTSGEQRLSGFLLWESAYSELYFTPTLWPDFGAKDLEAALAEYQKRERRFGQ